MLHRPKRHRAGDEPGSVSVAAKRQLCPRVVAADETQPVADLVADVLWHRGRRARLLPLGESTTPGDARW